MRLLERYTGVTSSLRSPELIGPFARNAVEAEHPNLHKGLLGTIVPSLFNAPGGVSLPIVLGMKVNEATLVGGVTRARGGGMGSPYYDTYGVPGYIRFPSLGGQASKMKVTPPFTMHAIYYYPSQSGNWAMLYTSDEKTSISNYNGLMIFTNGSALHVVTADNTGTAFSVAGGAGDFSITSFTAASTDVWCQAIVSCQSATPGGGACFAYINGVMQPDPYTPATFTSGQAQVGVITRHSNCGWQRTVASWALSSVNLAHWQLWNRALTKDEMKQLADDPLATLRLHRRRYYRVSAATRRVSLGGVYPTGGRIVLAG